MNLLDEVQKEIGQRKCTNTAKFHAQNHAYYFGSKLHVKQAGA
jgi:hypothetical protein